MANLHLRDVEEVLVRKLHQRARAAGHSAAEEHRRILRGVLLGRADEGFLEAAARLRRKIAARGAPKGSSAVDLIREDRDNDESHR